MTWRNMLGDSKEYGKNFLKWCGLSLLMGGVGGLIGAGFHHALHGVTALRGSFPWLLFILPLGGLLSVWLYKVFRLRHNRGTNEIIDAVLEGRAVSPLVAPLIFLATAITHLFGGSAGREGAALQIGGSVASLLGKWFKLGKQDLRVLTMSGMSAVFAGLFGTPLTACLFTLEFELVGTIFTPALLPCFITAIAASSVSAMLGVHAETHLFASAFALDLGSAWRYVVLAVLIALVGIGMCRFFHEAEHAAKKWFKNPYLRIVIGAGLVIGMTLLAGDQRYNGAGMDMALKAVAGETEWYSFILKLVFTGVTLAAGFKGGEIVPTFCIGATFGCAAGALLGLDPGFAAALGLVGLFCSVTNAPLASIVLSVEMFGGANLHVFALVCVISFVLSGKSSLYASQVLQFSKKAAVLEREVTQDVN